MIDKCPPLSKFCRIFISCVYPPSPIALVGISDLVACRVSQVQYCIS